MIWGLQRVRARVLVPVVEINTITKLQRNGECNSISNISQCSFLFSAVCVLFRVLWNRKGRDCAWIRNCLQQDWVCWRDSTATFVTFQIQALHWKAGSRGQTHSHTHTHTTHAHARTTHKHVHTPIYTARMNTLRFHWSRSTCTSLHTHHFVLFVT